MEDETWLRVEPRCSRMMQLVLHEHAVGRGQSGSSVLLVHISRHSSTVKDHSCEP